LLQRIVCETGSPIGTGILVDACCTSIRSSAYPSVNA
jgi:hypothetical protein